MDGGTVQCLRPAEDVDASTEVQVAEWFEDYPAAGLRRGGVAGHQRNSRPGGDDRSSNEELVDPVPDVEGSACVDDDTFQRGDEGKSILDGHPLLIDQIRDADGGLAGQAVLTRHGDVQGFAHQW